MPQITIQEADGSTRSLSYQDGPHDPQWQAKREKFAQHVAHGMPPAHAYIAAYHGDDTAEYPIKSAAIHAGQLLQDTQIVLRIYTLKTAVARKVVKKYDYNLQKALEDCETGKTLALAQGDTRAFAKFVELQSKLVKILAEQVDHNHTHQLDEASTELLLEMKKALETKRKKLTANTVTIDAPAVQIEDQREETP